MEIKYYPSGTLSSEQIRSGLEFIHRRFFEEWSINRIDINGKTLRNRANVLLHDNNNLIGWLGIESDGEIVNCCIDEKYNGVYLLQMLIKKAYDSFPQTHFSANVPTKQLGSACAFLKTGMKLDEPPQITIKEYKERSIKLVRLINEHNKKDLQTKDKNLKKILGRIKVIEATKTSLPFRTKINKIIKSNYKSFIICLIMSFILYFILIKNVAKISWQDYSSFVLNNASYKEDQEIFNEHFGFLSNKIESYEKLSCQQQINLVKELPKNLDDENTRIAFSQILNITNRNLDIIRVVRNIRKFHKELIKNDIYNKKNLKILNSLCEAYRLVLSDTGDVLVPHAKINLQIAKKQFKIVLKDAENLPNELRDEIKLESLRYLIYCSLRLEEENSRIDAWAVSAKDLKKNNSKQDQELEEEIEHYYENLTDNDPNHEYLKAKLLRYLKFSPLEKRNKIHKYISGKTK